MMCTAVRGFGENFEKASHFIFKMTWCDLILYDGSQRSWNCKLGSLLYFIEIFHKAFAVEETNKIL